MSDDVREAAVSGQAWEDFCDALKSAGQKVLDHSTDDLDRIEGFRYLSRLTRGGLQSFIEANNRTFPRVLAIPEQLKIGCDNPDAYYLNVNIDPAHAYRITGRRGTVNYLGIGAYSGGYNAGAATPGRQGYLEDNDPDPERMIDIIASVDEPERLAPGQRWLRMEPITTVVILRNFYLDRTTEHPSELQIECLDPPAPDPGPMTAEQLVNGLAMAGLFVHGVADRFIGWVEDLFLDRPNTLDFLPADDNAGGWGDPNQLFRHGYWTLEPGQALEIVVPPIEAYYWNFQLNNLWEESLDYRYLQVTVNQHTATYEADGSARIIVADEDPGTGNWIHTGYRRHGTMGLRYNQVVEDLPPECRVVDVASL
ncbi:MAG: hypothetical protein OES57_08455 [Acidimicrobiia bacterium]|nr:hypothetical protein [Acidimicrobiia bacterium]